MPSKAIKKNMLIVAAVAPVALFGALPAHADTTDGPTASLLNGVTAQSPVASLTNPAVGETAKTVDGLITTAQGAGEVRTSRAGAQDVVASLGAVAADALGLKIDSIATRCVTTTSGAMKAITKITGGTAAGRELPTAPVANLRLPLLDGALAIFNQQSRDARGALTVTGARVVEKSGQVTTLAVSKCVPADRVVSATGRKADHEPVLGLFAGLLGKKLPEARELPAGALVAGLGGTSDVTGMIGALTVTDPLSGLEGLTKGADLAQGLPTGKLQNASELPDVLSLTKGQGLSALLGGLPGLSGALPAGIDGSLPKLPM